MALVLLHDGVEDDAVPDDPQETYDAINDREDGAGVKSSVDNWERGGKTRFQYLVIEITL